ncbi:AAA family ATPase [Acinetobacter guillouiae]|uniref:AAA family ATPase n=1 Tax=Acinetobacter guillouiae TaxID=106649 RepID=UPI0022E2E62F|nr:AAA family ATPase [Acinetobacter guillouiae]
MKLPRLQSKLQTINPKPKNELRTSWRDGKTTSERGYGYRWQKYRLSFLQTNPLCVYCLEQNRVTEAKVVDHIVPHRGDQDLFWNADNHQSLCMSCHSSIKQQEEQGSGKSIAYVFMPEWLQPVPRLTIVFGCSGSGKSTWVKENAKPDDVVLDLDELIAEISGKPIYKGSRKDYALAVRKRNSLLLEMSKQNLSGYLILTGSTPTQRNWWISKLQPCKVKIMQTPHEECIARIMSDDRRTMQVKRQQIQSIDKWKF